MATISMSVATLKTLYEKTNTALKTALTARHHSQETRMIDIDKVKVAFAATPKFCQQSYVVSKDGGDTAVCAISALVVQAGVSVELVKRMVDRLSGAVAEFFAPVLHAEYGIPTVMTMNIPRMFDAQANEWNGVLCVIAMFEQWNAQLDAQLDAQRTASEMTVTEAGTPEGTSLTLYPTSTWTWTGLDDSSTTVHTTAPGLYLVPANYIGSKS